jgi:hypothetical protein
MGKKFESGIRDEHPGSYLRELINNYIKYKTLIFLDADPDPRSFRPWIWDVKIRIRDPE